MTHPSINRHLLFRLLLVLHLVPLALSAILIMAWLTIPWNPMLAAFITPIQVTNATNHSLRITPIGAVGSEGKRVLLPIFRERWGGFVPAPRSDFPIPPSQSLEILYDWDDVNLAEFVVVRDNRTLGQLVADPNHEQDQYRPPDPSRFTINDVTTLDPVPSNTAILLSQAERSSRIHPLVVLLIALPWFSFAVLVSSKVWRKKSMLGATPQPQADA